MSVHTDNDLSAHSGKRRPGYEKLLAQIRDGETDAVLAWHTDRLHRSPIPEEAEAIVSATIALLAGASLRGIAAQWNAEDRPTSTGGVWHSNALRVTLLRPRNAGLMEHRGQIIGKAEWPAIVPEAEWRALIDKLADPRRRTNGHGASRKWLGSGLYRCECGVPVICSQADKARVYRCRDGCGRLSRRQADVDDLVMRVIVERLRQPDVANLVAQYRGHECGPWNPRRSP